MNDDVSFEGIIKAEFGEQVVSPPSVGNEDDVSDLVAHDMIAGLPGFEPVSQSPTEDSEILQLQGEILAALNKINEFNDKAHNVSAAVKQARDDRKNYLEEVNRTISRFDAVINGLDLDKKSIDKDLKEAQFKKDKLLADLDHLEEAKRADKLLKEARQRWQDIIAEHDWLWAKAAREYQQAGIEFIASAVDRDLFGIALLDQMGLGKTLQARGAVDLIQNHPKFGDRLSDRLNDWATDDPWTSSVLWVCPDGIKDATRQELAKWSDAPVVVLDGNPAIRGHIVNMAHDAGMTLVVGYAQIRNRGSGPVTPELFEHEWPIIVADEIQEARNELTSTFFNVRELVRRAGFFVPMSGTPVENKPVEFWVTLHLLTQKGKRQNEFPKSSNFENMYLYSNSQHFMHGAFEQLMKSVSDMVLRRTKKEVAVDLPDKIRSVRFVRLQGRQRELYDQMRDRLYVWLDEQKSDAISATNFLSQLTRLRQINLIPSGVKIKREDGTELVLDCDESAKIDDAMGLIRTMMQSNEKCLIFSNFNHVLYHIQKTIAQENLTWTDSEGNERLVETGAITGDTKSDKRASYQQRFNDPEDDLRVVVGNIQAMGLGLNLQGGSQEIFLDLYWNPARNEQAEDREHRIGQKNNVTIHIIQAEETVDAFIAEIIERKAGNFEMMFERKELRRALDAGLI